MIKGQTYNHKFKTQAVTHKTLRYSWDGQARSVHNTANFFDCLSPKIDFFIGHNADIDISVPM